MYHSVVVFHNAQNNKEEQKRNLSPAASIQQSSQQPTATASQQQQGGHTARHPASRSRQAEREREREKNDFCGYISLSLNVELYYCTNYYRPQLVLSRRDWGVATSLENTTAPHLFVVHGCYPSTTTCIVGVCFFCYRV